MAQTKRRRSIAISSIYLVTIPVYLLCIFCFAYTFLVLRYSETGVPVWEGCQSFLDVCACLLLPQSLEGNSLRLWLYRIFFPSSQSKYALVLVLCAVSGLFLCPAIFVDALADDFARSPVLRRGVWWVERICLVLICYYMLAFGYSYLVDSVLPAHSENAAFQAILYKLFYLHDSAGILVHYFVFACGFYALISCIVLGIVCARRADHAPQAQATPRAAVSTPAPSPVPAPVHIPAPEPFPFVENGNPFRFDPGVRVQHLAPSTSPRQDYVALWCNGRITLDTIYPGGTLTLVLTDGKAIIETDEGPIPLPPRKPIVLRRVNDGGQKIALAALTWLGGNVC